MQKKLLLIMTLLTNWSESAPGLGTLEYDKLNTDLADLKYEVEEEDLEDFSKLLDEGSTKANSKANDNSKFKIKTSGFKKKNTDNKGVQSTHNIGDLKKFFNTAGVKDQGSYDDDNIYAVAKAIAGAILGTDANETRKYRKGTKSRGFHKVHHKDEYKKDKLFYEDDETNGEVKKIGGKVLGFKMGAGAGFDKGHFRHNRQKGIYGKQGYLDQGFVDKQFEDFSDSQGFDGSFSSER